jgi:RNA polymerase sigma factor (sigma-70 family)
MRSFLRQLAGSENRLHTMLGQAIEQELTPRQGQMVHLYFLEQHSMAEIASMLDVNPSTVSRTLAVARTKLKKCMRYGARELLSNEAEFD